MALIDDLQTEREKLLLAIASGARQVTMADGHSVTYDTAAGLKRRLDMVDQLIADLSSTTTAPRPVALEFGDPTSS